MPQMLKVSPFKAEYRHTTEEGPAEWRPCQIFGIGPSDRFTSRPYFVGIAEHDGVTFPIEAVEVRRVPA